MYIWRHAVTSCIPPHLASRIEVPDCVLEPSNVIALGEVLAGVGATALLPLLSAVHSDGGVDEQVLKLKGFDQIRVPDHATVRDLHRAI